MATMTPSQSSAPVTRRPNVAAWVWTIVGLAIAGWWIWTWSRVDRLITEHVADHGALPISPLDRSVLYADGTTAQRELSAELSSMSGLYPWGRLPLFIGASAAVLGMCLLAGGRRGRTALALVAGAVVLTEPLRLFGESMWIALDILE